MPDSAKVHVIQASEWPLVVALRRAVFIDEQGVTEDEEFDEFDADAIQSIVPSKGLFERPSEVYLTVLLRN